MKHFFNKSIQDRLSLRKNRLLVGVIAVIQLLVVGVFVFSHSYAAISNLVFEAESGSFSGAASFFGDATASGNGAVQFTSSGGVITLPNPGAWTNITGNLAGMPAGSCGDTNGIWPVPGSATIISSVSERNLYKISGNGTTWTEMGLGSGSAKVGNRIINIVFDPTNNNIFWEAGIYGAGVFKTTDGGVTFSHLGNTNHTDGVGIDFTDPARKTLVSAGHEMKQSIVKSTDGGNTWTNIGNSLPSDSAYSSYPIVIDANTYVISTSSNNGSGTNGIYRTTNGGTSWTKVSDEAGERPALTVNGTFYYTDGQGLAKSSDNGITWTKVGSNLKSGTRPNSLPDGRLISIDNNNRLVVSSNGGSTWTEFGASLPYSDAKDVSYSEGNDAFYIWHDHCDFSSNSTILPDANYRLK